MPELKHTARVSGRTAWALLDDQDREVMTGEHSNLILNGGLDALLTNSAIEVTSGSNTVHSLFGAWRRYLALGTGSAAPAVAQTALSAEVARTDSGGGFDTTSGGEIYSTFSSTANSITLTSRHVRVHTFSSAYNITEYGFSALSGAGAALSIRELFRDGGGNPIAISVQATQKIKVTHTFTLTLPLSFVEVTAPVTNLGNVTVKGSFYRVNDNFIADFWRYVVNPTTGGTVYPQLSVDTFNPAGAPAGSSAGGTSTVQAYTNGTFSRVRRVVLDVADGNGTLHGIALSSSSTISYSGWRMGFTNPAPIAKDNTKKLTLDVVFSVARA